MGPNERKPIHSEFSCTLLVLTQSQGVNHVKSQTEIQQQIADRILEALRNGVVPWRKTLLPDKDSDASAIAVSRRNYTGVNLVLLDLVAMSRAYV